MMQIAKWYVVTLGPKGYEQVICQSSVPQAIQSGISYASKHNHFVITIVQLTEEQYDQMFAELYPERERTNIGA